MNKTALQFFGSALLLALVGAGVVWGIDYYRKIHSPEYLAQLKFQELEARARADTYGGSTPEETLALFIDALKRGDIDLASKYFVVDEQEKEKIELSNAQIQNIISDVLSARKKESFVKDDKAIFEYTKNVQAGYTQVGGKRIAVPSGNYLQTIMLGKNEKNKWKILEL